LEDNHVEIYGDGLTGRDFCYVKNVVQANILSAMTTNENAKGQIYNVALNDITSLNDLFLMIKGTISEIKSTSIDTEPTYSDFRTGDIKSSRADISKISSLLGYEPTFKIKEGLVETIAWYVNNSKNNG